MKCRYKACCADCYEAIRRSGFRAAIDFSTNRAEADRMLRRWATLLVNRLDEIHGK